MKFVYKYIKMMKIQQEVLTYCVLVEQEHLSNRGISGAQQIELCTRQGVSEENRFLKIKIKSKDFQKTQNQVVLPEIDFVAPRLVHQLKKCVYCKKHSFGQGADSM